MAPTLPPNLSIRNLTPTPFTLAHTERFAAEKVGTGTALGNACGVLTSLFHATDFPTKELLPSGDALSSSAASHHIKPFGVCETDVPSPSPREVLRLTFEAMGVRYETDAPSPTRKSVTMRRVGGGAGEDFTAVYLPAQAFLAIFSSSHLESWMSKLDDDLHISALSIPGTHNSPCHYFALPSVRCQVAPLREQLNNGVRFLDVRVSAESDTDRMPLVHSAFPVSFWGTRYFHEVLDECYAFLDANPSEILVMSVKREGTGRAGDKGMSRHLRDGHIAKDEDRWFTADHVPRLREVRGKIVLLRRFAVDEHVKKESGGSFGINAASFPDNCADGAVNHRNRPLIRVQDYYNIGWGSDIDRKIEFGLAHLTRAAGAEAYAAPVFLNFLSASNFFNAACWPERIAARVNPAVVEHLCMRHGVEGAQGGCGATGIVVTDWVGAYGDWDLVRCVVGMNARHLLKG